jgi:hypothetical protein
LEWRSLAAFSGRRFAAVLAIDRLYMQNQQTPATERIAGSRRLALFAMLAIAGILTATTAAWPDPGSWVLPGICLGTYAIALLLLLALSPPGLGTGFAAAVSLLLAAGTGRLSLVLWALAQGEVSTARDRQTIWTGAAACLANLSLLIATVRYILAAKQQLRWWHVVLGAAAAVPPAWILMLRII